MNRRGLSLLELIVVIVIIGVLAALLLPTGHRSVHNAKVTRCSNNLSMLWKMQHNYVASFGHHSGMPRETGEDFWLKLSRPPTVLIGESLMEIYECPLEGSSDGCDYRGPSGNVNTYEDRDPVGADVDGNHGAGSGGNVLLRAGDVQTVGPSDALWVIADKKTTGGSPARHRSREMSNPGLPTWFIGGILGFLALLLLVQAIRPPRVEPRPWAFWTAFLGLGGAALILIS